MRPRRRGGEQRSATQGKAFPSFLYGLLRHFIPRNDVFRVNFRLHSLTTNHQPLATLIVFFYLTPHRQMSYFWGTGREPPTKRIIYVSNRTHFPRWLRTFRSIGHHRPRNCEGHFRRSCTQGAWRQTRR